MSCMLRSPPAPFQQVIQSHFASHAAQILQLCEFYLSPEQNAETADTEGNNTTTHHPSNNTRSLHFYWRALCRLNIPLLQPSQQRATATNESLTHMTHTNDTFFFFLSHKPKVCGRSCRPIHPKGSAWRCVLCTSRSRSKCLPFLLMMLIKQRTNFLALEVGEF